MDQPQVLQSLDTLWFYTNIFTCSNDPLPSQAPPPSTPKSGKRHSPLLNLQDGSDEIVEGVNVNTPCEPETEVKDRGGGRRKRRKRRKRSERQGTRKMNGVGSGFDKKLLTTGHFKLNPASWSLLYNDEIAMKERLKSWAYAVACIVK